MPTKQQTSFDGQSFASSQPQSMTPGDAAHAAFASLHVEGRPESARYSQQCWPVAQLAGPAAVKGQNGPASVVKILNGAPHSASVPASRPPESFPPPESSVPLASLPESRASASLSLPPSFFGTSASSLPGFDA